MKSLLKLSLMTLIIMGLLFTVGCESDDDTVADHVLVGNWDLSNFEQSATYVLAADIAGVMPAGTALGAGTMVWAEFSALGVSATVNLKNDGTFTLSGNLPAANDTLGSAPAMVPLNDTGTWTAADDMSTLLIDGGLYDLGGLLTLDDDAAPTVISMYYVAVDTSDKVIPVAGVGYFDGSVENTSATTLGWTKQ